MKRVEFHRVAESEMVESARFYELRSQFLGEAFLDAGRHSGNLDRSRLEAVNLSDFLFELCILNSRCVFGLWRSHILVANPAIGGKD